MRARASSVEETRGRILLAVRDLARETLDLDPTLEAVGTRAGVSVQTVLRHFGSRDALFDAALEAGSAEVQKEREAPVGDVPAALRVIVDHYEKDGDFVLAMLAREQDDERIRRLVRPGRTLHRTWVRAVFAPQVDRSAADGRESFIDLLVIATDVYTWKLLRRDRGLDRDQTEARLRRLVDAVLSTGDGHA